jgi:hypothetical protein
MYTLEDIYWIELLSQYNKNTTIKLFIYEWRL